MAKAHGKKAVFKVKDAGAVLRDISEYLTSAGLPRDVDTAETSGLGTNDKTFVVGLRGATIPIEGSFDPTVDGYLAGLLGFEPAVEWEYYPQGTASGMVKYTGKALLSSYESNSDLGAAGKISGSFTVNGEVARALVP